MICYIYICQVSVWVCVCAHLVQFQQCVSLPQCISHLPPVPPATRVHPPTHVHPQTILPFRPFFLPQPTWRICALSERLLVQSVQFVCLASIWHLIDCCAVQFSSSCVEESRNLTVPDEWSQCCACVCAVYIQLLFTKNITFCQCVFFMCLLLSVLSIIFIICDEWNSRAYM